jgi:hypothetical protein
VLTQGSGYSRNSREKPGARKKTNLAFSWCWRIFGFGRIDVPGVFQGTKMKFIIAIAAVMAVAAQDQFSLERLTVINQGNSVTIHGLIQPAHDTAGLQLNNIEIRQNGKPIWAHRTIPVEGVPVFFTPEGGLARRRYRLFAQWDSAALRVGERYTLHITGNDRKQTFTVEADFEVPSPGTSTLNGKELPKRTDKPLIIDLAARVGVAEGNGRWTYTVFNDDTWPINLFQIETNTPVDVVSSPEGWKGSSGKTSAYWSTDNRKFMIEPDQSRTFAIQSRGSVTESAAVSYFLYSAKDGIIKEGDSMKMKGGSTKAPRP